MKKCKACGDPVGCVETRRKELIRLCLPIFASEVAYCTECADELFRGRLSIRPARLFSAGAGCPLEPNDDAGPYQENAIRDLEG